MPSYKLSQWYLLHTQESVDADIAQANAAQASPSLSSAAQSRRSLRNLNNGFSINPDGQIFWRNAMSVGEPRHVNMMANHGVDLSKKHVLTQTTQGKIWNTTQSNTLFYECGQSHPTKKGRRLSQDSAPPSRRTSAASAGSHSTIDDEEFGMGKIRKDSRDSEVQFMGNIKHKYHVTRDGTRLYNETVISPKFSQNGGTVLPVDDLLLKKRSPSVTALRPPKTSKEAKKPVLGKRSSSRDSNAPSSISSHESCGSEHSISGTLTNVGFNEAKTHYIDVPFGARAKNTYHRGRDGKKSKPGIVLTKADFGMPVESVEQADLMVAGVF